MSIAAKDVVRLECERIHLLLLEDGKRGLADIAAGRTEDADTAIARLQQRRKASAEAPAQLAALPLGGGCAARVPAWGLPDPLRAGCVDDLPAVDPPSPPTVVRIRQALGALKQAI